MATNVIPYQATYIQPAGARIADAVGQGLKDVGQLMFRLQQAKDLNAARMARDARAQMQLLMQAAGMAQTKAMHDETLASQKALADQTDARIKGLAQNAADLKSTLQSQHEGFLRTLEQARQHFELTKPDKPAKPDDDQKLVEDRARIARGLKPKWFKGSPADLEAMWKKRIAIPQGFNPFQLLQGMGDAANTDAAPAPSAPLPQSPAAPSTLDSLRKDYNLR